MGVDDTQHVDQVWLVDGEHDVLERVSEPAAQRGDADVVSEVQRSDSRKLAKSLDSTPLRRQ